MNHIPGYEDRAKCPSCDEPEDLNHILLKCRKPGQQEIWELVWQLWSKKHNQWPTLTIGLLLGCYAAIFRNTRGRHDHALERLFTTLVSESMHLIWRLRCETVISRDNTPLSYQSIHNRWLQTINDCLALNRLQVNIHKLGVQALRTH